MKIPEYITCASGEVTIAIARYLEGLGYKLDDNLTQQGHDSYFFVENRENIIHVYETPRRASWGNQQASIGKGFKTLREFVASLEKQPSWRIGCRTVEVKDGALRIESDDITISKSTLKEMLAALE